MAKYRHLKNAPIREAVIEMLIEPRVPIERLKSFAEKLKTDFPTVNEIRQTMFGFEAAKDRLTTSSVDHGVVGFRLTSEDEKYVLQVKVDGFTFSRIAPYQDWNTIADAAKRYWKQYRELVAPATITRLATRYINVMEIPLPIVAFKDYLTKPPEIPDNLPQELAGFLNRFVIVNTREDSAAAVILALEGASDQKAPIVLDIDVFKNTKLSVDSDDVWDILGTLRQFKNEIFFESITEKTAELFE